MIVSESYKSSVSRDHAFGRDVLFDGMPFDYQRIREALITEDTIRFPQEVVELNILIDALGPANLIPTEFRRLTATGNAQTPTFALTINNQLIYCECTNAESYGSLTWRLNVDDWSYKLARRFQTDEELSQTVGQRYIAIIPSGMPQHDHIEALTEESVRLLKEEDLTSFEGSYGMKVPASYPLLSDLQTVVASGGSPFPNAFVQMPASTGGGPMHAARQLLATYDHKAKQKFSKFRPIWLIIGADPVSWRLADAVESFEKMVGSLKPFQSIFVANSNESFCLTEE